eukprot:748683-Hanusia_phi.AAC.2
MLAISSAATAVLLPTMLLASALPTRPSCPTPGDRAAALMVVLTQCRLPTSRAGGADGPTSLPDSRARAPPPLAAPGRSSNDEREPGKERANAAQEKMKAPPPPAPKKKVRAAGASWG